MRDSGGLVEEKQCRCPHARPRSNRVHPQYQVTPPFPLAEGGDDGGRLQYLATDPNTTLLHVATPSMHAHPAPPHLGHFQPVLPAHASPFAAPADSMSGIARAGSLAVVPPVRRLDGIVGLAVGLLVLAAVLSAASALVARSEPAMASAPQVASPSAVAPTS